MQLLPHSNSMQLLSQRSRQRYPGTNCPCEAHSISVEIRTPTARPRDLLTVYPSRDVRCVF
eukprot:3999050-Prymnesium_polylepis.1